MLGEYDLAAAAEGFASPPRPARKTAGLSYRSL